MTEKSNDWAGLSEIIIVCLVCYSLVSSFALLQVTLFPPTVIEERPMDVQFNVWVAGAHVNQSLYNDTWYRDIDDLEAVPAPTCHNDSFIAGALVQAFSNDTSIPISVRVTTGTFLNLTIERVSIYTNRTWHHLFDMNATMIVVSYVPTAVQVLFFGHGTLLSTEYLSFVLSVHTLQEVR